MISRLFIAAHALKLLLLSAVLGACLAPVLSFAQQPAVLLGTVTDISGAVIPGATITARSVITGSENKIAADGEGGFRFAQLVPGEYLVTCVAQGFSPVQQRATVGTNTPVLHFTLSVAGTSETIAVKASTMVEIDTSSTAMSGTLDEHAVEAVPLNGRSFTDTLAFAPGVVPVSSAQSNAIVMAGVSSTPPSGDLDAGNLSVSGQRETANGFMVNGSNVVEGVNMGTAIVPNLDSIDQLKVLTNNFDAEYGNYSGGQVVVTTKSGTNDLHGSAFEFLRNTVLDARNYFDSARARYDRNQFGGTLGGPIRKDQTFFFVDYQGTRMTQGVSTGLIPMSSSAERLGDFSAVSSSLTGTVTGSYWANLLSQKLGYPVQVDEPYYAAGCTNSSACILPNAAIPQSVWSAPGKALLQYIPQPNHPIRERRRSPPPPTIRHCATTRARRGSTPTRAGAMSRPTTRWTITQPTILIRPDRAAPMCPASMRSRPAARSW